MGFLLGRNSLFSQHNHSEQHSFILDPNVELQKIHNTRAAIELRIPGFRQISAQYVENNALSDEMQRQFNDIKSYDLIENNVFIGTCTWSPYGVWYYLKIDGELIAVYPELESSTHNHIVEFGIHHKEDHQCDYDFVMKEKRENPALFREIESMAEQMQQSRTSFGEEVRDYRVAFVTTGEFYQLNGNAPGPVNAVITATINGLTTLYLNELSVRFTLSRSRLYTNPNTDPFDPALNNRTGQAAQVVADNWGPALYDIGHAIHRSSTGDGWESGGLAQLNSVCRENGPSGPQPKASGWSGSYNTSGFSWIALIGHEFGHMFGAEHTFNGIGSSCTDAISETTAYEIGSGTTIMSYNGICDDDQNIPASGAADNYFHVNSLLQMRNHILGIGDCAAKEASNNNLPVVDPSPCGANYTIPKSTPFYLEGMAEDADGHELTYCWEQFDEDGPGTPTQGMIGTAAATRSNAPLFRSYPPTSVPYRYFPDEATVRNGNQTNPFDALPALSRTINMKLTVRDNRPDGGAFTTEDLALNIANTGPLIVPNQPNWNTGDNVTINWNTVGSDALCEKADVLLSVDGGITYPYVLGEDVDYASGSLNIEVSGLYPNTTQARIKVKCDDYECFYFYDITDRTFSIISECDAPTTFLCPAHDQEFDRGDSGLNMTNLNIIEGVGVNSVTADISFSNSETVDIVTFDQDGVSCKTISDNYVGEFFIFQVDKSGEYTFDIEPSADGFGFISLFTDDNFSAVNGCPSFVSSSALWAGNGSTVSARTSLVAQLTACTNYRIVFYNYQPPASTSFDNVTGPGSVIEQSAPNADFGLAYMVVGKMDNIIKMVSQTADFTSLPGGEYVVYAVSAKSGGATPPNITNLASYVGEQFNEFYIDGDCFLTSANSFDLTINGSCSITGVENGATGMCDPMTNLFTQEVIVTFDNVPSQGELSVNGQLFPIGTSPQMVTVNIPSNGEMVIGDVFFTEEPNCISNFEVQAPENCCPFEVNLQDSLTICEGNMETLDAGQGGLSGSYSWFKDGVDLSSNTPTIDVSEAGTYLVEVRNDTECLVVDQIVIEVSAVPTIQASDDVTICDGTPTTLSVTTNGDSIRWSINGDILKEGISSSLNVSMGGTYLVEAYYSSSCPASDNIVVTAKSSPSPDLGGDQFICEGESVILDATTPDGVVYNWFMDGSPIMNNSSMLEVNTNSTIRVEVGNDGDCFGMDEVVVSVEGFPTLNVSSDVTICDGEETILEAMTNASLIKWYVNGTLMQSGPMTTFTTNMGGDVRVEAGNSDNCQVAQNIIVTAKDSPKPNLGFDVRMCEGEQARLSSNTDGVKYVWYKDGVEIPMETDSFILVDQSGIYKFEVTNDGDCMGEDEIQVDFFALPVIEAGDDLTFCSGTEAQVNAMSSSDDFEWFKDGAPYAVTDLQFNTMEPGQYVLEAKNEADCSVFDTLNIEEIISPVVDLGDDQLACDGDDVTLEGPNGNYNYEWFVGGMSTSSDPSLTVNSDALVVLIVTDQNDCSGEDNVEIDFEPGPSLMVNETNVELCEGQSFNLELTTNATSIKWFKDDQELSGQTTTMLQVTEAGVYKAQGQGNGDCVVEEQINVVVNSVPVMDLEDSYMACEGEPAELSTSAQGDSYEWTFNGNVVGNMSSYSATMAGTYTLTVTNEFDCSSMDMTEVSFVAQPTIDGLPTSSNYCEGSTLELSANSNASSFQWLLNGNDLTGENSSMIEISMPGNYTLQAIGQGDCTNSFDVIVNEVAAPKVDLGDDQELCPGQNIQLDAGTGNGLSYVWSGGENSSSIVVMNNNVTTQSNELHTVVVTNSDDCSSRDSITITLLPVVEALITSNSNGVCLGDSMLLTASGGTSYTWNGPSNSFEVISGNTILVYPEVDATFSVEVSDNCPGNQDDTSQLVLVHELMDASAGMDTCIIVGKTIQLNASGGVSYIWEDNPTIVGNSNIANPEVNPEEETTYVVNITDANGCSSTDSVVICVVTDPLSIFKSVTAITPNGDGKNDNLQFPGLEAFEKNKLVIYNRWGNIVFEKENYQISGELFEGLKNGEELPADTYYYILTFDDFTIKETLTILKNKE